MRWKHRLFETGYRTRIWDPITPVYKILVTTTLNPKNLAVKRELREACRLIGGSTSILTHHVCCPYVCSGIVSTPILQCYTVPDGKAIW